jgi:putative membrane protein
MIAEALDYYCGPPPVPDGIWLQWNFDPFAIALMALIAIGWLTQGRKDTIGRGAFFGALALIGFAFLSPICALTVALFSVRVAHHVILIAVTAPLLAIALPWRRGLALPLPLLTVISAITLWIWHAPIAYGWAIGAALPYWLMQLTLLATSWLFWREIFSPQRQIGPGILALLSFVAQMGLLGAILVFARRPIYAPHFLTTEPFGISALSDQQLAGLVMWVPAMFPYIAVALWLLMRFLGKPDDTERHETSAW